MGFRMRKSLLIAAAVLVVLAVVSGITESGLWSATAVLAQPGASLSGVIVITERMGLPPNIAIADVTVSLYSTDRILQTKSNQQGQFGFANVPSGTYILEATHPGFKTKNLGTIQLAAKGVWPFSITMDIAIPGCPSPNSISYAGGVAGRTLKGVVLDAKQPIADAEISLASAVGTRVVASRRSTGKGEFEFANVEPGQYVLHVSHPGYHDELTEPFWIVRESGTEIVLQVLKLGQIRVCQ